MDDIWLNSWRKFEMGISEMKSAVYTKIDHGTIYLGNDIWERQWSNFLGNTIEVRCKLDDCEWVGVSGEFCIQSDVSEFGYVTFGNTEWSEVRDAFAAGVIARYSGELFEIEIQSILFHEAPGMLRRYRLYNKSAEPQYVHSVMLEDLKLPHKQLKVLCSDFGEERLGFGGQSAESALAIVGQSGGIILGVIGGGYYDFLRTNSERCTLEQVFNAQMAPGALWTLSESILLPFFGKFEVFQRKQLTDTINLVERYRAWVLAREHENKVPNN